MLVLNSDISIGAFRFSGAHTVRIRRSIHSYADTATITLPSICTVIKGGEKIPAKLITGNQFNDGDPVTISLGYNNALNEEFRGFVKRRDMNMPLKIECEGYSYQLRRNNVSLTGNETVAELVKTAAPGNDQYPIKTVCDIDDQLTGLAVSDQTGADLVDLVKKASGGSITAFFIEPDQLWAGLAATSYANGINPFGNKAVKYTTGYNAFKDNTLRPRTTNDYPTEVLFGKRLATGEKIWTDSSLKQAGAKFQQILNHAGSKTFLQALANEKELQLNYEGYEGKLTGFLQPFALPGYTAFITDSRYPELQGNYLVESTEVLFGIHGARRIVEAGARLGWAKK